MANLSTACKVTEEYASKISTTHEGVKHVLIDQETQRTYNIFKRAECDCKMETDPRQLTGLFCPRVWDAIMCWEDTSAGTTVIKPCPFYINKFNTHGFVYKTCLPNGTWYKEDDFDVDGWANYSECVTETTPTPTMEVPALIKEHLLEFRIMYNVGYGLSLVFLVIAMFIMVYFKKLHCARNAIHMNLFVSFIFRAAINLIRDNLVVAGMGFPKDLIFNDSGGILSFRDGPHWECRLFFSIFQYAVASSYMWIFVEAVYIHMLIFVSVFTEKIKVIWFMLLGWSLPFVFVLIWSIARLTLDNSWCWNTTENRPGLTWILKGPIMATVVINFFFFISLVWILYTKLSASSEVKKSKYRTLARSTLLLIPVFGVYYIVFTLPLQDMGGTTESVMLFIEMFFNSYQGVFIALILCFINAEVRAEIRKFWVQRKLRRGSTSSTVVRCSKLKFKREIVAPSENTYYEMPVVFVENGNVVPARKIKEEEPFLGSDITDDKCVVTDGYNSLRTPNNREKESCENAVVILRNSDCAEKQPALHVHDIIDVEVSVGRNCSSGDNVANNITKDVNGGRMSWKEARISWIDKT